MSIRIRAFVLPLLLLVTPAAAKEKPLASGPLKGKWEGKDVTIKSAVVSKQMGDPVLSLYDVKIDGCASVDAVSKGHKVASIWAFEWKAGTVRFGSGEDGPTNFMFLGKDGTELSRGEDAARASGGRIEIPAAPATGKVKLKVRVDNSEAANAVEGQIEALVCPSAD